MLLTPICPAVVVPVCKPPSTLEPGITPAKPPVTPIKPTPEPIKPTPEPVRPAQKPFTHPPANAKLSKFFLVTEFTRNNTRRFISLEHYENCKRLAEALDDVRVYYNKPIKITSGVRTPEANRAAGGAPGSYHLSTNETCAADIIVRGISNYKVWEDYNERWVGGLGRYSNGTTHFDLGRNRRWDYSNRVNHTQEDEGDEVTAAKVFERVSIPHGKDDVYDSLDEMATCGCKGCADGGMCADEDTQTRTDEPEPQVKGGRQWGYIGDVILTDLPHL